uniref:Uncharacterized protein n=1 Tax=viral metagenome TaxID=1070528 RepID=A0A6C0C9C3_9ZZZZ
MLLYCKDIIPKICDIATDKTKISLSATCKLINGMKRDFVFREQINLGKIRMLPNFDNFEFILINDMLVNVGWVTTIPKKAKKIYFKTKTTNIPQFVTHLTFCDSFDEPIQDCIPDSVTHLVFGKQFDQPIANCIPSSVSHLTFGHSFDQVIPNCLPASITHLEFGWCFNKPIKNVIPKSVTHLKFGWRFTQLIRDYIPDSVTHLEFDSPFNCSIENGIPNSVTHLTFGDSFNQSVEKYLPKSITHLKFGRSFCQPIENCELDSLVQLELGGDYWRSIRKLCAKLTHLTIREDLVQSICDCAPLLTHLTLICPVHSYKKATGLTGPIGTFGNTGLISARPTLPIYFDFGQIPPSVTHLSFSLRFNKSLYFVPKSIIQISLPKDYNQKIIAGPDTKIIYRKTY